MEDWEYMNDPPRPTFAKVQTLIACGQTDFTRANLIGLDLRELDLSGLDFKVFASPWLTTGYDYDFPEEFR
jgi:hypothetical protein